MIPIHPHPLNFYREVPDVKKNLMLSRRIHNFPPLVLVVEDDNDTSLMLKYLLEIWKYQVILAVDD